LHLRLFFRFPGYYRGVPSLRCSAGTVLPLVFFPSTLVVPDFDFGTMIKPLSLTTFRTFFPFGCFFFFVLHPLPSTEAVFWLAAFAFFFQSGQSTSFPLYSFSFPPPFLHFSFPCFSRRPDDCPSVLRSPFCAFLCPPFLKFPDRPLFPPKTNFPPPRFTPYFCLFSCRRLFQNPRPHDAGDSGLLIIFSELFFFRWLAPMVFCDYRLLNHHPLRPYLRMLCVGRLPRCARFFRCR